MERDIVADAVVVIMIEKLRKLKSAEAGCPALKSQVDKGIPKLKRVYEFLKDEGKKESHTEWTDRLQRVLYQAEDDIDIFFRRIVELEQRTITLVPDVLETLCWKGVLFQKMRLFLSNVTRVLKDQHLYSKGAGPDSSSSIANKVRPQYYDRWRRVNADQEDTAENTSIFRGALDRVINDRLITGDDSLDCIAVIGEKGSGKTYLAWRIYNRPEIKKHFPCRAWVHVSVDHALKDIRYAILKQISKQVLKNSEHMEDQEVTQALQKELYDQRYLIVLDDYDDPDSLYELLMSLPESNKGRVLVTTRSQYMALAVDYRRIELENLGEEDTVKLFKEKVRSSEINLQDKDIKKKIFPASGGLPLKIVLLGGLLMNLSRETKNWHDVIEREQSLTDILTLSYNYLRPEEKPCFLYLTLFPKATPIPVRRIIRLWLGEELLMGQCDDGLPVNPEDRGEKYLEDLIQSNMVEVVSWKPNGTPRTCQVVTPLYDTFRRQAVDLALLHIHDQKPKDSGPTQAELDRFKRRQSSVRWLAENSNITSFSSSDPYIIQRMRSFNSFYTRKGILTRDLGKFLRAVTSQNSHRLLRVLDLEGVYKPYLPQAIGRLVLLKYLGLRSTVLDSLPDSVGDLPQLETLDIKNTNIVHPVSIWKSKSLKHLYLNGFPVDPLILKRYIGSGFLPNLRTLSGLYVSSIDDNLVNVLITSLTNLTKLGIKSQWSGNRGNNIAGWVSRLTNLQSLKLVMIEKDKESNTKTDKEKDKESPPPSLPSLPELRNLFDLYLLGRFQKAEANQLPSCLKFLTLSKSEFLDDPMHNVGQLLQLRTLRLLSDSYVGKEMSCSDGAFPSLRVLKLWKLTKLTKLTLKKGCMPKLKELEIRKCPNLPFDEIHGLEHLESLEELILTNMPEGFVRSSEKIPKACQVIEVQPEEHHDKGKDALVSTERPMVEEDGEDEEPSSISARADLSGVHPSAPFTE
ncbi:disease resistance protein RPP13-like [Punica granatum]|uniref:Disease resistance protein RPP13-like n=3 Tax=Punica granatum TaxID=22663 RepID=A0A6P8CLQ8_PUNGR|nr:disease resistance protein RPP13-like [Punica granatum]